MAASPGNDNKGNSELIKIYDQLCQSYRAIDDFRAKLLGFLPLASAGGAFLLLNEVLVNSEKSKFAKPFLGPLGLFGFVVTLGLFFYEMYGIRKCDALIRAGKQLECSLGITDGQFRKRPRSVRNRRDLSGSSSRLDVFGSSFPRTTDRSAACYSGGFSSRDSGLCCWFFHYIDLQPYAATL